MLYQMTEMEGRYYTNLTPSSLVSYFSFPCLSAFPVNYDEEVVPALKTQGDYWAQLQQQDKTGWTEEC